MIENNVIQLRRLADDLNDIDDFSIILIRTAEALNIEWTGKTPKALRKKIAKRIFPDSTGKISLKEERTRVLAHVNSALEIAEDMKSDTIPLQKPVEQKDEPEFFDPKTYRPQWDTPKRQKEKADDAPKFKDLSLKNKTIVIANRLYDAVLLIFEVLESMVKAIIHSPFFVIYAFLFIFVIAMVWSEIHTPSDADTNRQRIETSR